MPQPKKGAKSTARKPRTPKNSQKYIRNRYSVEASITLGQRPFQKRFELKPRGQRGDLQVVSEEELNDHKMQTNVIAGLVEVIGHEEMLSVVEKQTINQQKFHPALAHLGNPYNQNKPYENLPEVKIKEEERIVVATHQTHDPNLGARSQTFVQRVSDPTQHPSNLGPANQSPAGSANNPLQVQGDLTQSADALQAADSHARANKNQEGPKSGLQGFTVRD